MKILGAVCIWLFGILLPVAALVVEMGSHMCKLSFFNPIPTPLHIILVASVPLGNFYIWNSLRSPNYRASHLDFFIISTAISVSACYALAFGPLMPMAVVACIFMGIGFLPLAPLISCIVGICLLREIWKRKGGKESFFGRSICSAGGLCMIFCCVGGILWSGFAGERFFENVMRMMG